MASGTVAVGKIVVVFDHTAPIYNYVTADFINMRNRKIFRAHTRAL